MPIKKELSEEEKKTLRFIAQNISYLMKEHALSIRDLSEEIDESRSTIHNYLSCRNPVTIPVLNKIAKRFNKPLDWFIRKHPDVNINTHDHSLAAEEELDYKA